MTMIVGKHKNLEKKNSPDEGVFSLKSTDGLVQTAGKTILDSSLLENVLKIKVISDLPEVFGKNERCGI